MSSFHTWLDSEFETPSDGVRREGATQALKLRKSRDGPPKSLDTYYDQGFKPDASGSPLSMSTAAVQRAGDEWHAVGGFPINSLCAARQSWDLKCSSMHHCMTVWFFLVLITFPTIPILFF